MFTPLRVNRFTSIKLSLVKPCVKRWAVENERVVITIMTDLNTFKKYYKNIDVYFFHHRNNSNTQIGLK